MARVSAPNPRFRVAVDIGGTFTDIVFLDADGRLHVKKVSSSVDDYARAIVDGLREVFDETGLMGRDVIEVLHGTTVASNALLELKGARTGLITTRGFRDVLEIRRLRMPRLYDLTWEKPPTLVERRLRLEVNERIDAQGVVQQALADADVEGALDTLLGQGIEALAVCLLNAWANPVHEERIKALVQRRAPGLTLCISSEVLPEIKEYERTSTTVINTYVLPIVGRYLAALRTGLDGIDLRGPLLIMQSNGGLMTAEAAATRPMHIIESGPAAGVVGAQALAPRIGRDKLITFDMGGTTAKASLVEDGAVGRATEYQVGGGIMHGSRLLTGAGYLLRVPAIDLAEVGAGGGSIVWLDAGGALQVGPRSAGASPGPLCYDLGGTEPTVTDANVVLGYLNPAALAGGAVKLNAGRAHEVLRAADREAARAAARRGGLRRSPDRGLEHDARDPGRLQRAGPRPARVRALRLRRQRPALRGGDGPGAGDDAGRGPAGAGPLLGVRAPLLGGRAPLRAHLAPPGARTGPGRAGGGLRAPGGRGARPARRRGLRRCRRPHHALGRLPLPGPVLRADRAGDSDRDARGGVRPRARAHLRPPRRRRRAGRDREPARGRAGVERSPPGARPRADRAAPGTSGATPSRRVYFGPQAGWMETPSSHALTSPPRGRARR